MGCVGAWTDQPPDPSTRTTTVTLTPRTLPPKKQPDVLEGFREIAACTGGKSQEKKVGIIRRLLLNCAKDGSEVKFLVRGACPVVL